jgi:UDP-GlcNAc:undecaprenyl-phosphate/decaprenyl-phosphate GlcNAc-1-phosphate transferase
MLILAWILPPAIAVFGSMLLCWLAIVLAPRLRFMDRPGAEAHKQHTRIIPYGGGAAMALAVMLALIVAALWPQAEVRGSLRWAVFAGAGLLGLLGFIDDARPIPAWVKLGLQALICAAAVSLADLPVDFLRQVHPVLAWLAAFAWLVVVTNAYNLLDHADGLSGAVALVGCAALAGGAMLSGDAGAARAWLCIAMAIGGFLVWNRPPARLYMGDAGSLPIGFLIGCGTLSTTFWPSDEGGSPLALLSPLLICAIPLFDTGAVVVKRLRRGAPIMRGDRNHISHRLTRLGIGPKASLGAVVALQVALASSSFQLRNADVIAGVVALAQAAAICVALVLLETSRDHG